MKTIYINPLHSLFTDQLKEAFSLNKTVVCSQRPLNGDIKFEYDNIGYGRYFAVGDINQYKDNWLYLDAAIVEIRTNKQVLNLINEEVQEEGITLEELLNDCTMAELAESLGYCYIE